MHSCFSFRSIWSQAPHHGGGDVTVVSRGEGKGSVKVVVGRAELERIVAGVTRRQCGCTAAARRHRHVPAPADSPDEQLPERARDPLLRRRPETEGGAAARHALGGISEEEA